LQNGDGARFMERYDPAAERATRDVVSRAIYAEMHAGRTTPNGGVWLSMAHLGPDNVRRQFKGMVERCADCGFDLAAGKVEVVPTAHYMMGGVEFAPDCTTEFPGLFVAGEDSGGVHGANRLGGNGVANSTVFGGIAGDTMAKWVAREGEWRTPDRTAIDAAVARAEAAFAGAPSEPDALEAIRERLYDVMWDDAGIVRNAAGLARAEAALDRLGDELAATRIADADRRFNVTWQDWQNLGSLIEVSRVIVHAAQARTDSRGAHFRDDYPVAGPLDASTYIRVRATANTRLDVEAVPVAFTRVRPGESLIRDVHEG
jgi:fumarate reductase flavoprotein subunit